MSEKSYRIKVIIFGTLIKGGSLQVEEFVDYPGVTVVNTKETRNSDWVRQFFYDDKEFKTAAEAVEAFKKDNPNFIEPTQEVEP